MHLSTYDLSIAFSDTTWGAGMVNNPIAIPLQGNRYFFLHKSVNDTTLSDDVFISIIDMNANGGMGEVVSLNNCLARFASQGCLAVHKHADGIRWWIISRIVNSNKYRKWLLMQDGSIAEQDTQAIGIVYNLPDYFSQSVFNETGNIIVTGSNPEPPTVFGFDRCTGLLSLIDTIRNPADTLFNRMVGAQFSPSGRYFYISRFNYIDQYDLLTTKIDSSRVRIADASKNIFFGDNKFQKMQLAPNGKIYIQGYGSPIPLSVIKKPDSLGIACQIDTFSIPFPDSEIWFGMPTYPHYRTPAAEVYQADAGNSREVCDSLIAANGVTLGTPHVAGVSYQWSSPQNATINSTQPQLNVQPTTTTTYILHIQDTANTYYSCTERWDTVTITVVQSCISGVGSSPFGGQGAGGHVRLYPNPASDILTIDTEHPGTLTITNTLGQTVLQSEIVDRYSQIVSSWPSGMYHYSFTFTNTKTAQHGKIVKQ